MEVSGQLHAPAALLPSERAHGTHWTGGWMDPRAGLDAVEWEGVSKSFRTGVLERELQMVQLSATRSSCIAILWVSLVSFAAITLCVASQRVFTVVICFVIDSVRKLLDTLSYNLVHKKIWICIHVYFLWPLFYCLQPWRRSVIDVCIKLLPSNETAVNIDQFL
jgi:hypothetical protein